MGSHLDFLEPENQKYTDDLSFTSFLNFCAWYANKRKLKRSESFNVLVFHQSLRPMSS